MGEPRVCAGWGAGVGVPGAHREGPGGGGGSAKVTLGSFAGLELSPSLLIKQGEEGNSRFVGVVPYRMGHPWDRGALGFSDSWNLPSPPCSSK